MTNYLFVYTSGGDNPSTQEEIDAVMQAWGAWFGSMGDAVVDGGNPTAASAGVASDGSIGEPTVKGITGYSIISAESMEAALAHAKGCPLLQNDGQVSVYETFAM